MHGHAHIGHLEGVSPQVIDHGDLQGERRRLAPEFTPHAIGSSTYRQGPGQRAMPVHVHADEEELFYVIAGAGLSWQNGAAHPVSTGDLICHPAGGAAHTLIAGEEGIETLVFASGSPTRMTWLPRAQAWWMGPRWLPHDGPNPFKLELAAGPLAVPDPAPLADRPSTIVSLADVEGEPYAHGRYAGLETDLGRAAGSRLSGLRHVILEPGKSSCPAHWHTAEEELFVLLTGAGEVELGEDRFPLTPGSLVGRPPGSGVEHLLRAGPEGLSYLAYGTRVPGDLCHYPRAGKLGLGGGVFIRAETVGYWDGE